MIHERLDSARWKSFFSLARLRAEARAAGRRDPDVGGLITGPADIALLAFAGLGIVTSREITESIL